MLKLFHMTSSINYISALLLIVCMKMGEHFLNRVWSKTTPSGIVTNRWKDCNVTCIDNANKTVNRLYHCLIEPWDYTATLKYFASHQLLSDLPAIGLGAVIGGGVVVAFPTCRVMQQTSDDCWHNLLEPEWVYAAPLQLYLLFWQLPPYLVRHTSITSEISCQLLQGLPIAQANATCFTCI